MNKLLLIVVFAFVAFQTIAQPYGNEWIDNDQIYIKIKIGKEGIYRLTYDNLNSVGFPLSNSDNPQRIQLYHRGVEVAIFVEGELDAVFNPSDYIEFYGQANDGTLDSELYVPSTSQSHNYYNLYSDTTAYFLTFNKVPTVKGKRMITQNPFTGGANDAYHFERNLTVYSDEYSKGLTQASFNNLTTFDIGEGFTGTRITENSNPVRDIVISNINQTVVAGSVPQLKILLVGRNDQSHDITVQVGVSTGALTTLGTYNFVDFNNLLIDEAINWSDISGGGNLVVRITVNNNGGSNSNISVSYIRLEYAQDFDMNGASIKKYYLQTKPSGGDDIRITNVPTNANVYDITDPNNVLTVVDTEVDANIIKCGFSDATKARTLWVNDLNPMEPILNPVSFRLINTTANYIIISHSTLMKPAGGFSDAVRAYAGYRTTSAGGGFDTLVVDIQQLYDQFSYGEITPLSIYRFMRYLVDNGAPENLFLIGKALVVSHKFYRRPISDFTYYDLVPTAGTPGADIPFTAGLDGTTYEAFVPTGRLSASKPQEIIDYLNKVVEHESLSFDDLWRKNLLHLSGGNSEAELAQFRGYVDSYANISKSFYLGGEITTQSKTTSAPVEFINVSDEVNAGLNLITFFGHSAPNVTDIDIGFVSDPANGYSNKGKYPMVVMNGCNAGNIYNDDYIFGEDWILTPNLGATAVVAHTSFGFATTLNRWSSIFYSLGYGDINYMDKSIGEIINVTGKQLLDQLGGVFNPFYVTQVQQMGLHGDPAIKLFGTQLPDYEISSNNVQPIELTNKGITANADSFAINLGVRNFAAYLNDSLEVFIRRTLQNGTVVDYDTIAFAPVRNSDTLTYVIDNDFGDNFGTNSFEIVLDPGGKLAELDELNNRIFFNYFIPLVGALNLSPQNFSVVSGQPISLKAQISSQPSENRVIEYEIDDNASFDSPTIGESNGTLITEWSGFTLPEIDSTAYYWHSKYKNLKPGEADDWTESSFTYIKDGDEGWAQIDKPQFFSNELQGLTFDDATKDLKFEETKLEIEVKTYGANGAATAEFSIDGQAFILDTQYQSCAKDRLAIVAFNHKNAAPYAPIFGGQVDNWTCGRSPQVINIVADSNEAFLNDILDAIQPNDFILLFTIGSFNFNNLSSGTLDRITGFGATLSILTTKTSLEPYIFYGQNKANVDPSIIEEIIADASSPTPTDEQLISTPAFMMVKASQGKGSMKSPVIGPSFSWDRLTLNLDSIGTNDDYGVNIIGLSLEGKETVLSTGINIKETDLNWIDPLQYPFIQLQYDVVDTIDKTPVQLDKWLINYTSAPEGVMTYLGNDATNSWQVELQEGDSLYTEFGFINITNKQFSNQLQVDYTIFNSSLRISISKTIVIDAPDPGDTTKFKIPIGTKGLIGVNNLTVFVNNLIEPEQLYVNNTVSLTNYLTVIKDETNPLLDVSFDGRYIYDGEIVSASPNVLIKILDANPLLFKTDTTGINIFITAPCEGCAKERIKLAGNYTPASKDSPFEINYKPGKLDNGVYLLSIQVEDASGNSAGSEPYTVHFEVINEATVTNFYPYPNPFSTSVRFVFTLTGNEIPDGIMIRILSVSGRVVRTITQDEIGAIHIGNNQTDFAWDGRDEFGDQLANGVYLYKVTLEINGERVELRSSGGDKGFKNGYGKMYLLK
jgi:Peptidase family C25